MKNYLLKLVLLFLIISCSDEEFINKHKKVNLEQLKSTQDVFDAGLKFRSMVFPDEFIDQASPMDMYSTAGLNAQHIAEKVMGLLQQKKAISTG